MSEMKRLVFGEGLMTPALEGNKRFTVRKYREGSHDFSRDEIVVGEFKDGLNILLRITDDTKKATFKKLKTTKKQSEKEGYYFNEEYFGDLKTYYPDLTWDTMGAIVFFEVLKIEFAGNNVPVVQFNEHTQR